MKYSNIKSSSPIRRIVNGAGDEVTMPAKVTKYSKATMLISDSTSLHPSLVTYFVRYAGITEVCGRCRGSGKHSYCAGHGNTCFGCHGRGRVAADITAKVAETALGLPRDVISAAVAKASKHAVVEGEWLANVHPTLREIAEYMHREGGEWIGDSYKHEIDHNGRRLVHTKFATYF